MLSLLADKYPISGKDRPVWGRLIALLMAAFVIATPVTSRASSVPLTLEEMVAISDVIVTARVTNISHGMVGRNMTTTARLEVLESLKGKKAPGPLELTYLGGRREILNVHVPQIPQLISDEEVTLFLSQPAKRLPKSAQAKLNMDSPLIQSYQIVGGQLGRFTLVSPEGEGNKRRKGAEGLPSDLLVTRGAVRVSGPEKTVEGAIGYAQFRETVAELVSSEAVKRASKGANDSIVGIVGKFAVPDRTDNPLVRQFDPLPALAYLTQEQYDAINAEAKSEQSANSEEGAEN